VRVEECCWPSDIYYLGQSVDGRAGKVRVEECCWPSDIYYLGQSVDGRAGKVRVEECCRPSRHKPSPEPESKKLTFSIAQTTK
jgi:hypothetical protein